MEQVFDIFNADAFSMATLTEEINRVPFVPHQAGDLGIFEERGIETTLLVLDVYDGTVSLIPNTPRGGPSNQNNHSKRTGRAIVVPHFPLEDEVSAEQIQNVRGFGGTTKLMAVQDLVKRRLTEMRRKHDATVEYGRIGAIKGVILDSDGSTVIIDLFAEFGQTQTSIDMVLGTTTTPMIGKAETILNAQEDALGAMTTDGSMAFCGRTFFSRFIQHPLVQTAYQYFQATGQNLNPLRDDTRYKGFVYGGIMWVVYRGKVGGIPFVPDSEAYVFPLGDGLFETDYAPADYMETVNTTGLPVYAKICPDPSGKNKKVVLDTQSNPISICKRPEALIKLTTSN